MITVSVSVGNTTIIMYVLIYYSMASSNYMGDKKILNRPESTNSMLFSNKSKNQIILSSIHK